MLSNFWHCKNAEKRGVGGMMDEERKRRSSEEDEKRDCANG